MGKKKQRIITIHQPEHLIWLGFVHRIWLADIYVIMDAVQYVRHSVEKRNKIRTVNGWQWVSVPVKKHFLDTEIRNIEISYETNWQRKYLRVIELNYKKADYFNDYYPSLKKIISSDYRLLADLNCDLMKFIRESFGIKTEFVKMSDLKISNKQSGSAKCLEICKLLEANNYLSGPGGEKYLSLGEFKKNNIKVEFHKFKHPIYKQLFEPFISNMSSIDLLLNYGPKSMSIIKKYN